MAIVLILLPFAHNLFKGYKQVYQFCMLFTSVFSVLSGLEGFGLKFSFLQAIPLASEGLVWVIPSVLGAVLGFVIGSIKDRNSKAETLLEEKVS